MSSRSSTTGARRPVMTSAAGDEGPVGPEPVPKATRPEPYPPRARPSSLPPGQALFTAHPSRVQFREYTAFEPVSVLVRLRNQDTVARRVRVVPPESTWFSISPFLSSGKRASKVAPGIEIKFRVTFTAADEHADYRSQVEVVTERETFLVEIEALGRPAQLEFPDAVRFEAVPANYVTMQPQLLRNVGRNEVAWEMRLPPGSPFRAVPAQGVLAPDQHAQVQVEVGAGAMTGDLQGQLDLVYDKGRQRKSVQLCATVQDVDISLDMDQVDLPPACIHLCTIASLRLFNDSDIPITYAWMRNAHPDDDDDDHDKSENGADFADLIVDGDNGDDAQGSRQDGARDRRPALFDQDPNFAIEPMQGELYPGGFIEFTVSFRPTASVTYSSWAYCNVSGRSQRLPLRLTGKGIGPTALLSFDTLDIGDVYVNAVYRYETVLKNVGRIQAQFSLVPSPGSDRFRCEPDQGVLESGESRPIAITFSSSVLGTFQEVLTWTLWGSVTPVTLAMSGNVVAPTFTCDVERLDFGTVAYGFVTARVFTLQNTSEIPIRFLLRCPQDGKFLQREVDIRPAVVAVLPRGSARIEVELCSETVQCYTLHEICVDIENVGTDLLRIPLDATCQVPEIDFHTDAIDFGRCYLRYPYGQVLELSNASDLAVRFEIVTDLTTYRKGQGRLQFDTDSATILPHSTFPLKIAFVAESLGEIETGFYVRTCGSNGNPYQVSVTGSGIGAHLVLSRTCLDFRQVRVLEPVQQRLTMRNDTPIEARYVAFAARRYSNYVVSPREGRIAPGGMVEMTVGLVCNDNAAFRDVIHVLVEDGDTAQVQCRAVGQGSTFTCTDMALDTVDMAYQMTVQPVTRTFTLRNEGVRAQTLTWRYDGPEDGDPVFLIVPDRVAASAGQSVQFTVEGRSPVARSVSEPWSCLGQYAGDKEPQAVARTRLLATFVEPHVEFSLSAIHFEYRHLAHETVRSLTRTVTLRNVTPLPVAFVIGVRQPFTVDRLELGLAPGQQVPVEVVLPLGGAASAPVSDSIQSELVLAYVNHPARDRIPLSAQLWYPNLAWASTDRIEFGTIVNNTVAVRDVTATNPTVLAADFNWTLVVDDDTDAGATAVFDVWPLFGRVEAGQSLTFRFSFFGRPNAISRLRACCSVRGGPDYMFTLQGQAGAVQYGVDLGPDDTVDFGPVEYHTVHERVVHVTNQGQIGFEVRTLVPAEFTRNVAVRPSRCFVRSGSAERLQVRFVARRPLAVRAQFQLYVAFFQARTVSVTGQGTCALVTASLPGALPDLRGALVHRLDQYDGGPGGGFGPVDHVLARQPLQSPMVDLGDIVRGTQRKLTFEVTNVGDLALSLEADKSPSAPFRLDPPRTAALAPAQSVRYTVTYVGGGGAAAGSGRRRPESLGEVRAVIQATVTGSVIGAPLSLDCRAHVTLPDVTLSSDSVDFGLVPLGFMARRYVRITNPTRVNCEWSLTAKGRVFTVSPKSGKLTPGAHADLALTLTPTNVRDQSVTVPITIGSNPRSDCVLTLRGRGQPIRVRFDPPRLQFTVPTTTIPPVAAPGQPPAAVVPAPPMPVQIVNDSDLDIELFSVEYDPQYLLDEERARQFGRFDGSGQMLIEPVRPGSAPIPELVPTTSSDPGLDDAAVAAPPPRPWRQVVVLGQLPADSFTDQIGAQHDLVVVNVDRVVDRYAQTQLDAKLVAAERRARKRPADAAADPAPNSVALALAVQDAMASGQAAYVTADLLQKLLVDYCYARADPPPALGPGQHDAAGGVLFDVTRCKVVMGGPRAAYGAVAALMDRGAPDTARPVRVYVVGFGGGAVLDPEAAAAFRVDPGLDVSQRIRAVRQAVVYGPETEGVAEPIADRIRAALQDQLDQYEQAVVRDRIPPAQLFQVLRYPGPRPSPAPSPFRLADPTRTRWVIPARGQVQVQVVFGPGPPDSSAPPPPPGPVTAELAFELAHDRTRRFTLPCAASVAADPVALGESKAPVPVGESKTAAGKP